MKCVRDKSAYFAERLYKSMKVIYIHVFLTRTKRARAKKVKLDLIVPKWGEAKLQVILTLRALPRQSFPEIVAPVLRKVVKLILSGAFLYLSFFASAVDEVWVCYSIRS